MRLILISTLISLLPIFSVQGESYKFAIVPKYHSTFFDQSGKGCRFAASTLDDVECIYRGPLTADVRNQDKIITELVEQGVDGIAVAVSNSEFLARSSISKAIAAGIPVITFDSDFDQATVQKYKQLSLAYIGTDNFALGYALGEQLLSLRPEGGRLLIQTGRPDAANLNLRIMGLRSALSGINDQIPPGKVLNNKLGWSEIRTPIPSYDKTERAIKQLESKILTKSNKIDAFVSVGGWPQNDINEYRRVVHPLADEIRGNKLLLLFANSSDQQLTLLSEHLATANIGQSPYEMGRLAILTLYKIITNQPYDQIIYTPLKHCTPQNVDYCRK
ncbi:substrate-binding domain-containing protein [Psychromonas sp. PT13]|uniref:substrate-binding domain-containing protein n=1 Tax=Psychromonas sp. PT13 TaxID=3439547 RepID=UPI003EBADA61